MKFKDTQTLIEQVALLFASFIWTAIVLVGIIFFWAYRDVQARWDYVVNAPPEALAQFAGPTATPSPTPWGGPPPTLTPSPTLPPTAVPTRVIQEPGLLPETLNPGETPVPILVSNTDSAAVTDQAGNAAAQINILPTPPGAAPAANVGVSGVAPTELVISSIGVDASVVPVGWSVIQKDGVEYSIWQVADYSVGWHKTSAPLGQPGNTVMAGHHNVNGEVFRDLVNVEIGDKITVYAGDQAFEYVVDFKTIVKEKGEPVEVRQRNAEWIAPTNDVRLTLVTCWPYTNNTHRVIVVAHPV